MHLNKVAGLLWDRCFPVNFVKFLRTTFLQKTSEQMLVQCPQHGGEVKKAQLFYIPVTASGYCAYFLLEMKRVEKRLKKKKMKFHKETLKKTLIILHRTKNK